MKKNHLLITSLALLSLNAFAQSTNYEKKVLNDDGTSTIVNPKFNNANGTSLISATSDSNGLCRLYGFDFSYGNLMVASGDVNGSTAIIDLDGKLKGWRGYSVSYNNSVVNSIVCGKNGQILTASNRIVPLTNDDDTFSILNPVAGNYNIGTTLAISSMSNLDGVCTYFGLGKAIVGSAISQGDVKGRTLIIGALGKAEEFRGYSISYNNSILKTITCKAGVSQGPQNTELNQTVEIPRTEYLNLLARIESLEKQNQELRLTIGDKDKEISRLERKRLELESRISQLILDLENEKKQNGAALKKLLRLQARLKKLAEDESLEGEGI